MIPRHLIPALVAEAAGLEPDPAQAEAAEIARRVRDGLPSEDDAEAAGIAAEIRRSHGRSG